MKIDYALYELEAPHALSVQSQALRRYGSLLKINFDLELIGYADCHPWPERGDLPLSIQLAKLACQELTPLTACSLKFAALDAEKRAQGQSILKQSRLPQSHFLIPYVLDSKPQDIQKIIKQGYTHVKLKMGREIDREISLMHTLFMNSSLKLRLDFNESLSSATFRHFLKEIQTLQDQIDFIEDPFTYDYLEWQAFQEEGWTLACDREMYKACHHPEAAKVLILKPAVQPFKEWQKWTFQTCIVTSYLGHPLDQLVAAYVATQVDPTGSHVHGVLSQHAYRPNLFSQQLNWQGSQFILPRGKGFGFDQELAQQTWISLA